VDVSKEVAAVHVEDSLVEGVHDSVHSAKLLDGDVREVDEEALVLCEELLVDLELLGKLRKL
jgi:hypothetical protein